jgi:hypothetical protein
MYYDKYMSVYNMNSIDLSIVDDGDFDLYFPDSPPLNTPTPLSTMPTPSSLPTTAPAPITTTSTTTPLQSALCQFLKSPSATFKSEDQKIAMSLTAENKHNVLTVLPTGAGKTLVYLVPASQLEHGKTTLVVIPLVSLQVDLVRRCKRDGVSYHIWKAGGFTDFVNNPSILIVSCEHLGFDECLRDIQQLYSL